MRKTDIRIRDLHIRRAPGLKGGLDAMKELSPDINIVHGDNATGKSTTARMIQKMIWREDTKGVILDGTMTEKRDDTEHVWTVAMVSDSVSLQRDGETDKLLGLPAHAQARRYMLSLPDLISHDEGDLLKEILRQLRGGLDLDMAYRDLGLSASKRTMANPAYKTYTKAKEKYNEEFNAQRSLLSEEARLEGWKREYEEAVRAEREMTWFIELSRYRSKSADLEKSKAKILEFDGRMGRLREHDGDTLESLENHVEVSRSEIDGLMERKAVAEQGMVETGLPESGCSDEHLRSLTGYLNELREKQREIDRLGIERSESQARAETQLKSLGAGAAPEGWEGLTDAQVGMLDKHYQDSIQNRQGIAELEERIDRHRKAIEESAPMESVSTDRIAEGIRHLGTWLRSYSERGVHPIAYVLIPGMAGLCAVFAAWRQRGIGVYLLIGLLLVVAATWLWLFLSNRRRREGMRGVEAAYLGVGLTAPESWTAPSVSRSIEGLMHLLQAVKTAAEHGAEVSRLESEKKGLEKEREVLDGRWEALRKDIHVLPDHDPTGLFWHLNIMLQWRMADVARRGHEAALSKLCEEFGDILVKCGDILSEYGVERPNDLVEAGARIEVLQRAATEHRRLKTDRDRATADLDGKRKQMDKEEKEVSAFYERLSVGAGDREAFDRLFERFEAYKHAMQSVKDDETAQKTLLEVLRGHSLYERFDSDCLLAPVELMDRARRAEELAGKREELQASIQRVQALIEKAKSGDSLGDLLAVRESALDGLEEDFEEGLSSIAGRLWFEGLREHGGRTHRPEVLDRADRIFVQVTSGRYRLQVRKVGDGELNAYDVIERVPKGLSKLSTGTRIQLLMSVRLAFVECMEESYRLPLLADELMATSDDQRSHQIVQALVSIARSGRQVFYFTAESDEVEKWRRFLEGQEGLTPSFVEIGRHGSMNPEGYVPIAFDRPKAVPDPEGLDRDEYAAKVGVPAYDLLLMKPGQLHLWYLTDDMHFLRECLQVGVQTFDQFKVYMEGLGEGADPVWRGALKGFTDRAVLLESFQDLWSVGRNRPIGRNELEASGHVTSAFMQRVSEKLEELKGDPGALVSALRNKEVPRFREESTDQLEAYLIGEGYIVSEDTIPMSNIRIQARGVMDAKGIPWEEGEAFLGRFHVPPTPLAPEGGLG